MALRLLIITPIFPPEGRGPAIYTSELVGKLKRLKANSRVITFTQNHIDIPGVPICSIPISGGPFLRQFRLLKKIIEWGAKADLLYAQGADVVGFASCLGGKLLGKPVVIKFVGDLSVELQRDVGKSELTVNFITVVTRVSLFLADRIIFPAEHLRDLIIKKYQIPKVKTVVIYNAVND